MKRINTLTRNLLMQKEDIGEFVEKVKEKVKSLCTKIRESEEENKYAEILIRQLSLLHTAYDEAKEIALREFDKKPKAKEEKKTARKRHPKKRRRNRRKVKLIYRGPLSGAPEHAKDIIGLLRKVFGRKHVSSNKAEGLIGIYIHSARSCRGNGKILLKLEFQRKHVADAFEYLSSHLKFGRGPRGNGPRFHVGREYLIEYRDIRGKISERRIRVLAIQKRHIVTYYYLRGGIRKFGKEKHIKCLLLPNHLTKTLKSQR